MSEATIQFQGRLTGEPQQNQAGNYPVVNFNVAVDGSRRDAPTIFYRVAVWGNRGQWAMSYLHKGTPVMVSGTLSQARVYQRKNGESGINLDVNSDHVDFVLSQPRNQQGGNLPQGPAPQYNQQAGSSFNQQAGQAPAPQNAPQGNNMGNYPNRPQNGSQGLGAPGQPQSVDPTDLPF